MKKFILVIAVIAVAFISAPAFAAQTTDNNVNTEVNEEYAFVEFKDLPEETQELLVNTFDDYDLMIIYQNTVTKLLHVTVVKDEMKKVFVQNEDGTFEEQK